MAKLQLGYGFMLVLFFLSFTSMQSQSSGAISGRVLSEEKEALEAVAVVLLGVKDSTYVDYTITDANGDFSISEVPKGNYILNISSLGYLSVYKDLSYTGEAIAFGDLILREDTYELEGVTLTAVVPVQIKQDTIAFNANSFKVDSDDNLEELLNKIPGMEIDSDGKVNAQGNEVTKIMIDGKEFFGGDPSIVLKNLSADAIANVEIIDKKSDESELTGVADGNKEVVINFTLKESRKNNGFGKISAGGGLDNRYFGNLNYNKFTSKTQFSVIGKINNINITGSNIQDFLKNADGVDGDGDDEEEQNSAQKTKSLSGYLNTAVAGVNVGHEFKEKESLNGDYFYNYSKNDGSSLSKRITFSNANNFDYEAENEYINTKNNHNLNLDYKNKSNPNNSLIVKGQLISDEVSSYSNRMGRYFKEEELSTKNDNLSTVDRNRKRGNMSLNFYQKLRKKGRSLATGLKTTFNQSTMKNDQNTLITRQVNTPKESVKELNTLRDQKLNTSVINFNFKYTEPLGGNHYMKLESYMGNKIDRENVYQNKTTITSNNKEEILQYDYDHNENNYQTRLAHSYNVGKINTYAAMELQDIVRSFGVVNEASMTTDRLFVNPMATVQYIPRRGRKYRLSYKRSVRTPRPTESSTVVNDLNPFSIRKGNPDLVAEKMDALTVSAIVHDFKSSLSFNTRVQYQYTKDAIIKSVDVDEDYVRTLSYQNNGIKRRLNTSLGFSQKLKGLGLRYSIRNRNFFNTNNAIINFQLNEVTSRDFLVSATLENNNKSMVDLKAGATYSVNNTSFSIEHDLDRKYTKQQYFSMLDCDLGEKVNFNTQFDYFIYTDNAFASNENIPLWNATVSYAFTKQKSHVLKLLFIDLLDKNIDIYRRSTTNYFEETTSESLGRYFIVSYMHKLNNRPRKG
ncbi:outer membrane beta-barrel protein [Zobellia uliginosa]|uniref:outer membrane beta-barrel protein n=1 Tax=Zobellia uliginosa TaxID=143224 RepID=UPI0026E177D8|nr:outer membrane beta-barrel protein [Zobellia uliginosa]MDO6517302.1 outer membrane beta-barrel protein [Zobellia uliginosa]